MKINLNDFIKVTLTDYGKEVYYHQYDELNEFIKSRGGRPLEPCFPKVDEEGKTKFQLWHFIEIYGKYIGMAKPNVILPLNIETIELSEQEPVIDKIRERVELEKLGYPPSAGYYKAIMKVLQIIDKYRESEDKE